MEHTITIKAVDIINNEFHRKIIKDKPLQSIINRDWIYYTEYNKLENYLLMNKLTYSDIINYGYILGLYSPFGEEVPKDTWSSLDGYQVTFETKPKQFKLYFEFFGYKMCTTVEAYSIEEAKEMVKNKVKFYDNVKTTPQEDDYFIGNSDIFEQLKRTMGL